MHPSSLDAYHETEVFTASPQRLRVMLIDGAIRALQTTKQHWSAREFELGGKSMERARAILVELLAAIDRTQMVDITARLVEMYNYMYQTLVVAGFQHEPALVDDVLSVLTLERDTWQSVCNELAGQSNSPSVDELAMSNARIDDSANSRAPRRVAPHFAQPRPVMVDLVDDLAGGFSIEA